MPFAQAIKNEVERLHQVSMRLETLADLHPRVADPLTSIAGSVRNTAVLLEVLIVSHGNDTPINEPPINETPINETPN